MLSEINLPQMKKSIYIFDFQKFALRILNIEKYEYLNTNHTKAGL